MFDSVCCTFSKNLIESNPITPRIYDLPKIHKEATPLRLIVNTIGGPSYLLTKHLALRLKRLVGNIDSSLKNSYSFINEIKDFKLEPNDILVSFDVVSLFTKIPINDAIDIVNNIIGLNKTKLVSIYLKSTFFSFQDEIYEMTWGVAMGSPLSPIVANLFMEDFETKALAFPPF